MLTGARVEPQLQAGPQDGTLHGQWAVYATIILIMHHASGGGCLSVGLSQYLSNG